MSRFKTAFCWWPVRLARHVKVEGLMLPAERMEFIGWVWMQRVNLTNNITHGWVAFLDSAPMPKFCRKCGQKIPGDA